MIPTTSVAVAAGLITPGLWMLGEAVTPDSFYVPLGMCLGGIIVLVTLVWKASQVFNKIDNRLGTIEDYIASCAEDQDNPYQPKLRKLPRRDVK